MSNTATDTTDTTDLCDHEVAEVVERLDRFTDRVACWCGTTGILEVDFDEDGPCGTTVEWEEFVV